MKILKKALWALSIFFIYMLAGTIFGGRQIWMSFVTFFATYLISIYYFKTSKNTLWQGLLLLTAPISILFLIMFLFFEAKFTALIYAIFIPVCSYLGWLYGFKRLTSVTLSLFFLIVMPFVILPNLHHLIAVKNENKNVVYPQIDMVDADKNLKYFDENKIIVLDFWTTSCGVCFKKFPDFEKIYLMYKNNPNIEFYSVNIPLKRDSFEKTLKLVDDLGYKFPSIYAVSREEAEKKLNIFGYPRLVIIKNGKIRFEGFLEIRKNIIFYNTINEIEKLIKEP